MTYKEFINKLEAHSFCMLNFEKESEEYLLLYVECERPIAALSLVDDDWKFIDQSAGFGATFWNFIDQSASFDATFLGAMAELADTPKEQRGDWEEKETAND